MPKVVVRVVETIGPDPWVDTTVRRAIDGVCVCCPPTERHPVPKLIRARVIEQREISEEEVLRIYETEAKEKR